MQAYQKALRFTSLNSLPSVQSTGLSLPQPGHHTVGARAGGKLTYLSDHLLHYLVGYLGGRDVANLSATDRYWWKQAASRVIAVVIDNTGSMRGDGPNANCTLQEEFLVEFLAGLNNFAKVVLLLVASEAATQEWQKQELSNRVCTPREALGIVQTHIIAVGPAFYAGGSTPLLHAATAAVNRGYRQVVCVTDGGESVIGDDDMFRSLNLLGTGIDVICDRYNAQFRSKSKSTKDGVQKPKRRRKSSGATYHLGFKSANPLASWCEVLFAALPESQSFLATVVGINNAVLANEIPGMQTLNLDDANKVKEAATNVRRKTVPREAGGGSGSISAPALLGERAARIQNKTALAETLCKRRIVMPEAKSQAALEQFLGERNAELLALEKAKIEPPPQWLVRNLPPSSQRKQGWYFQWIREMDGTRAARGNDGDAKEKKQSKSKSSKRKASSETLSAEENKMQVDATSGDEKKAVAIPLAVQELLLTREQAASEWAKVCADKLKLDAVTREACQYTLQRYALPPAPKADKSKTEGKSEDGGNMRAVTVEDLVRSQVVVSPIEPDYENKMRERQESLELLAKCKLYPMSAAVFFWLRWREIQKGTKMQTIHNRLLGVPDTLLAPPIPKPRVKRSRPTKKKTEEDKSSTSEGCDGKEEKKPASGKKKKSSSRKKEDKSTKKAPESSASVNAAASTSSASLSVAPVQAPPLPSLSSMDVDEPMTRPDPARQKDKEPIEESTVEQGETTNDEKHKDGKEKHDVEMTPDTEDSMEGKKEDKKVVPVNVNKSPPAEVSASRKRKRDVDEAPSLSLSPPPPSSLSHEQKVMTERLTAAEARADKAEKAAAKLKAEMDELKQRFSQLESSRRVPRRAPSRSAGSDDESEYEESEAEEDNDEDDSEAESDDDLRDFIVDDDEEDDEPRRRKKAKHRR